MLPPRTAELLEGSGHDATTPAQLGAHSLPDDERVRLALLEGRVIVTENAGDFVNTVGPNVMVGRRGARRTTQRSDRSLGQRQSRARSVVPLANSGRPMMSPSTTPRPTRRTGTLQQRVGALLREGNRAHPASLANQQRGDQSVRPGQSRIKVGLARSTSLHFTDLVRLTSERPRVGFCCGSGGPATAARGHDRCGEHRNHKPCSPLHAPFIVAAFVPIHVLPEVTRRTTRWSCDRSRAESAIGSQRGRQVTATERGRDRCVARPRPDWPRRP